MKFYELRVLSGNQLGAALPLHGASWNIGSAGANHLQLSDTGIQSEHAVLSHDGEAWVITLSQSNESIPVIPDVAFSIGPIELIVCHATAPWQALSSVRPKHPRRISTFKEIRSVFFILMVLSAAFLAWPAEKENNPTLITPLSEPVLLEPERIPDVLRDMLKDRQLEQAVSVIKSDNDVILSGEVTQRNKEIISRMLEKFSSHYHSSLPVNDQTHTPVNRLEFDIKTISKNEPAYIETSAGEIIFVGDEIDGFRLEFIKEHEIGFMGKEPFRIKW